MTTIAIVKPRNTCLGRALKVGNYVVAYEGRVTEIRKVGAGRWEGVAFGEPFTLVGGRESGGAPHEWFLECPTAVGPGFVRMNSARQALRAIENC